VMLVTDEHPAAIARLHAALVSRLVSGLVVRVDPPGADLRRAIIERCAAKRGLALTPEAVAVLVARTEGGDEPVSVREIEGMVAQIDAVWRLGPEAGRSAGRQAVEVALRLRGRHVRPEGGPVPVERVVRAVCAEL